MGAQYSIRTEQLRRLGMSYCKGALWHNEFGKYRRRSFCRNLQDFFVELNETIHVVSNDAYRRKIHNISSFLNLTVSYSCCKTELLLSISFYIYISNYFKTLLTTLCQ